MFKECEILLLFQTANPWSLITTLCVIADSVNDITEVIRCLLAGETYIMAIDVVECLYCVATFLLCFKTLKYQDVWTWWVKLKDIKS